MIMNNIYDYDILNMVIYDIDDYYINIKYGS